MRIAIAERDEWVDRIRELRAASREGVLDCDCAYLALENAACFHWVVSPVEGSPRSATLCGRTVGPDWLVQPELTTLPFGSRTAFWGYPVVAELCLECMERMARVARGVADQLGRA